MWSFGQTRWVPEDSSSDAPFEPVQTVFGECSTFSEAIDLLYGYVEDLLKRAQRSEASQYEGVLADINVIRNDPGIRYDPDQWEEMDFYNKSGDLTYFVTE